MPKDNLPHGGYSGLRFIPEPFIPRNKKPVTLAYVTEALIAAKTSPLLDELAWCLRDVFGHGQPVDPASWGEYRRCLTCGDQQSIEKTFNLDHYAQLKGLEATTKLSHWCQSAKCDGRYTPCFSHREFRAKLQERFVGKTVCCSIALNSFDEVIGFAYGWVDQLSAIWQETEFLFGPDAPDQAVFAQSLEHNTVGALTGSSPVLYMSEVGVTLPYRDGAFAKELVRLMFGALPDWTHGLPAIGISQPDKMGYVQLDAAGHQPVFSCGADETTMMAGRVDSHLELWSLSAAEYKLRCAPAINRWKRRISANLPDSTFADQASKR